MRHRLVRVPLAATTVAASFTASSATQLLAQAAPPIAPPAAPLPSFTTQRLSDQFLCEGASFGDFNNDGKGDVVSGPYWYAGPDFKQRFEIAEPVAYDPLGYSKNFFAFPYDFDRDGWMDLFFVGFPGERAWWAQNPKGEARRWVEHDVFPIVDNESPWITDVTGDGQPELLCFRKGAGG